MYERKSFMAIYSWYPKKCSSDTALNGLESSNGYKKSDNKNMWPQAQVKLSSAILSLSSNNKEKTPKQISFNKKVEN